MEPVKTAVGENAARGQRPMRTIWLPALLVPFLWACGAAPPAPDVPVAQFAGESVPVGRFEEYLARVLGENPVGSDADRVKSRLLDAFIEEEILLYEALRHGIRVDDREVETYLAGLSRDGDPPPDAGAWAAARRNLMVRKLRATVIAEEASFTEEELDEFLDGRAAAADRGVILRTLPVGTRKEASKVRTEIVRRRMRFEDAVSVFGVRPDQGQPVEVNLESLTAEVRNAVAGLAAGGVSQPVEVHGTHYLFLVEGWTEGDRRERAREELASIRAREASEHLLDRLERELGVVLHTENLPFEYVAEDR